LLQERQKVHCLNTLFSKLRINQVQYWTFVPAQYIYYLVVIFGVVAHFAKNRAGTVSSGTIKKSIVYPRFWLPPCNTMKFFIVFLIKICLHKLPNVLFSEQTSS
jgi:hypothetical protein